MIFRRLAVWTGILAISGVVLHQASSTAQNVKDATAVKDAAPRKADAKDDFAVRYARAQLKLAELTLQKAQEMNRRVAQTLAKGVVEQFADDVEFAKGQVEDAQHNGEADPFKQWLRRAELNLRAGETQLKFATETNRKVKGAYPAIDFERMRASIDLARMRVERGRELADSSPELKLKWQVEMIGEELSRVEEMVSLSLQNRLAEFF